MASPTGDEPSGDEFSASVPHVDTLIIGAGLSGIGVACRIGRSMPGHSYLILEGRRASGGTWDLFRYPGIRSDSDLHTLGYSFRPWTQDRAIADGADILSYIRDTAREYAVDRHIRFNLRAVRADWSSRDGRWMVHALDTLTREPARFTCRFLFSATGYYNYEAGHTPEFRDAELFRGTRVHPQHWPGDLDHTDRRVVVIGSGATAVTLVPAMARRAAHVTLLQRSPSYVLPVPSKDSVARVLGRVAGPRRAYELTRRKNLLQQTFIYRSSRRFPRGAKAVIRFLQRRVLPSGYPLDPHFRPAYDPWDQRLCVVPDGDLFKAISSGRASVVTDRVERFTERGIVLRSGRELAADIVVTATGLDLLAFGGVALSVDGRAVDVPRATAYKGMMLSGVPNFAFAIGYTNISWTLRVGLVGEYFCRLMAYMEAREHTSFEVGACPPGSTRKPMFDFAAGYAQRSAGIFPKQADSPLWRMNTDYTEDERILRYAAVDDGHIRFTRHTPDGVAPA
ncbi:flavin-containing monooxygenase [Streptomyces parvus]|uniref:NAD(P)/FAD-dependent oxidoreductase n=1 Tax=Streptomyces parvus TaxID=66428 RepID=A0A7K3S0R4_9ACTN|nr:NAD(P)/FAD-dependent oxidoreductase [Streptomyces parvus]NEC21081.1 NAD(P)/FAD-dependent oxidoreductase [Streptomyces parvus]